MASFTVVLLDGIVEITVEGTLDLESSHRLLLGVAQNADVVGRHLLLDLRNAKGALSFRDVYQLVQVLGERFTAFRGRIALLDKFDEGLEKAQFFEASATESGFDIRTFLNEDAAVQWLEEYGDA